MRNNTYRKGQSYSRQERETTHSKNRRGKLANAWNALHCEGIIVFDVANFMLHDPTTGIFISFIETRGHQDRGIAISKLICSCCTTKSQIRSFNEYQVFPNASHVKKCFHRAPNVTTR